MIPSCAPSCDEASKIDEEREQRLAILLQAFNHLGGILPPIFQKDVDRRFHSRAVRRKPDLAQVLLYAGLHGKSDLV